MTATMLNGRPRKTLASQLDRLDNILDALSDGLNGAVAMVVEHAVAQAVEKAVAAALADPTIRERLTPPAPTVAASTKPSAGLFQRVWATFTGWVQTVRQKAASFCQKAWTATHQAARSSMETSMACLTFLSRGIHAHASAFGLSLALLLTVAFRFRKPLLIATVVGSFVGVGCYLAGPLVASSFSGMASALIALGWLALRGALSSRPIGEATLDG